MSCECITNMNASLARHHTRLGETILLGTPDRPAHTRVTIVTERADGAPRGKRPVAMLPSFCPFCGTRYVPAEDYRP